MKKNEREQRIISLLDARNKMSVEEMGRVLGIAPSTLRKQLAEMQERGLIIRTYGGIMSVNPVMDESFDSKLHKSASEKLRMAVKARALIDEGQTIALASGTSVYSLCNAMNDLKNCVIYTNSMNAADCLGRCPSLEVHVCGGIIRSHTGTITGNDVHRLFSKLSIDIAFFGCDSIDLDGNVYSDNLATATSEYSVIMNAKKVYLLCDSTKLGKKSVAKITSLDKIQGFITGADPKEIPDNFREMTEIIFV